MKYHLQEVTEVLQKINPILRNEEPYVNELQDMIEVVLNSCIQLISMAYLKAVSDGAFALWTQHNTAFKDFLELYGEFCSHVSQRCMQDIEVDDMLAEVLSKLRDG